MRTFGTRNIEYFEFQLEGEEKVYKIPLAAHMPFSILYDMKKAADQNNGFAVQIEMLRKYMGNVVDELSAGVMTDILNAWSEESVKSGASVGES